MGRAYRARDTHLDREGAIKALTEAFAGSSSALRREKTAREAASISLESERA